MAPAFAYSELITESDQLCRNEESELYRCGQKASNALFDFIDRRPVECIEVDRD